MVSEGAKTFSKATWWSLLSALKLSFARKTKKESCNLYSLNGGRNCFLVLGCPAEVFTSKQRFSYHIPGDPYCSCL